MPICEICGKEYKLLCFRSTPICHECMYDKLSSKPDDTQKENKVE